MPRAAHFLSPLLLLIACKASTPVGAGQLQGTVVLTSGAPAAGALVVVEGSLLTATTDSHGKFVVSGLPPGHFAIDITAAEGDGGAVSSGLRFGGVILGDDNSGLGVGEDIGELVLGPAGTIMGTVDMTGVSVTHVTAVLTGFTETEAQAGLFTFPNLLPGNYELVIFAQTPQASVRIAGPLTVHVTPELTTKVNAISIKAAAVTTGTLHGQARLAGNRSSLAVHVALTDSDAGTAIASIDTTDDQGNYVLTDVLPGIDTVTATMSGYQPVSIPLVVVGGVSSAPILALSPVTADGGP